MRAWCACVVCVHASLAVDPLGGDLHSRFEAMDTFDAEEEQVKAPSNPGTCRKSKKKNKKNKKNKGGGPARDEVDDMSVRELRAALAKFCVTIPPRVS